jgi:hypothetical protein
VLSLSHNRGELSRSTNCDAIYTLDAPNRKNFEKASFEERVSVYSHPRGSLRNIDDDLDHRTSRKLDYCKHRSDSDVLQIDKADLPLTPNRPY